VLYRPEPFAPLTDTPWRRGWVIDAVRGIVDDIDSNCRGRRLLWSADANSRRLRMTSPTKSLYAGAAGTLYGLDELRRRGMPETSLDLARLGIRTLEAYQARPDSRRSREIAPEQRDSALLAGETGILLVAFRLAPSDELAAALLARVEQNVDNEAEDLMWGTPGTLLAAALMLEWSGDDHWRVAGLRSAEALLSRRDPDGVWTQRLYGEEARLLGPIHGAVGNVQVLGRLLDDASRMKLHHETAAVLAGTAVLEDGLANWPHEHSSSPPVFLRWCAGGPGIVASSADYLDEELLLAGAEQVWQAGPFGTASGPGICCGTAGNGYALLEVFQRTGDERWLARARRFAVHALEQVAHDRDVGAPGWWGLWQGDPGVALFAADCVTGRPLYPLLDAGPAA
jgi:Lanthionine synthetase C-like protein